MKHLLAIAAFFLAATFSTLANNLDAIQGKWTVKKSRDGATVTQVLEFKRDKLIFKMVSDDGQFVAEGAVEVKKVGAFNTLRIHKIKGGSSENDLSDIDGEHNIVFFLKDGLLYLASNFDQERDNEKPTVDAYSKVVEAVKTSGEIVGSWKLKLELADNSYDYTLRIAESGGKLNAALISPRSGEHKVKSVSFESGKFTMEIDREIENNAVTFSYTGKLEGQKLSGTVSVKGIDATGAWTATK